MTLIQHSALIRLLSMSGESDPKIKNELETIGVIVSSQAIGKFKKKHGIAGRKKPDFIAAWFGSDIEKMKSQGSSVTEITGKYEISPHILRQVLKIIGAARCDSKEILISHGSKILELSDKGYSLRECSELLEKNEKIKCGKTTVAKVLGLIKVESWRNLEVVKAVETMILQEPLEKRISTIWALMQLLKEMLTREQVTNSKRKS